MHANSNSTPSSVNSKAICGVRYNHYQCCSPQVVAVQGATIGELIRDAAGDLSFIHDVNLLFTQVYMHGRGRVP
jgi:hypothetical protein